MSFLAPLFLAGAAAVALPFLFHLIRRSSNERTLFSSLMFLEPSPPRITKRSRLEHILLLVLRCLVLCLLALAFARPFLPRKMAAAPPPDENVRVAILVDSSASMRREDLWNQAQGKAVAAVRALNPADAFAVYVFDQQLRSVLNFSESAGIPAGERAAAVQSRLAALSPAWSGTHIGHALVNATEHLLEQSHRDTQEQDPILRLILISDLQSGAKLDGLQGFEWPKRLEIQLEPVRAKDNSNAGIQLLDDTHRAFLAATNLALRARVNNSANSRLEQFQLQWRSGAETVGDKIDVYVPPGQSRILAPPPRPEGATILALTGDSVDFDNRAFSAQPKAEEITIAYFGNEAANNPRAMRYYLHRAFEQTNLSTRVLVFSNSVPSEAASAGLLILGATPTEPVLELAREFLARGKTVLLPMRDAGQANIVSTLLGGILVSAPEAQLNTYALFGRISFQDPLFAPFADARFSDFTKIRFWKHRALNLANITNANVVASFDSGLPALAEVPIEKGRLLLLASTWEPSDSQLALSSKFVPLLFGILEQSANYRSASRHYLVGQSVALPEGIEQVTLPDGSTREVASQLFAETGTPGLYQAGDFQFAVNVDPSETRLNPLAPEDFIALAVPVGNRPDALDPVRKEQRERHLLATDTEARQKLWRYFVLGALALVVVESWLAGRLSRGAAPPPAPA